MNTTKIEEQLKAKCRREISEIVKRFLDDIKSLEKTYNHSVYSFNLKTLEDIEPYKLQYGSFKYVMEKALNEKFNDAMLKVKTKQLLDKLDLL